MATDSIISAGKRAKIFTKAEVLVDQMKHLQAAQMIQLEQNYSTRAFEPLHYKKVTVNK